MLDLENDDIGIGIMICSNCGDFILKNQGKCPNCNFEVARKVIETENKNPKKKAHDNSLFICSNCGAFIGLDSTHCNACGEKRVPLTAEIDVDMEKKVTADGYLESAPKLFLCANCGAFMGHTTSSCEICGMNILENEEGEYTEGLEGDDEEKVTAYDPMETLNESVILCPKCGGLVKSCSSGCRNCGNSMEDIKSSLNIENRSILDADLLLSSSGMFFICKECGAFLAQDAKACIICGLSTIKETAESEEIKEEQIVDEELKGDSWYNVTIRNLNDIAEPSSDFITAKPGKQSRKIPMNSYLKSTSAEAISDCKRLWMKKAKALRKLGRYKEALKSLNNALGLDGEDRVILLEKANLFYEMGEYRKAAKVYSNLLEMEPKSALLWNKLGNSLLRMGNQKESIIFYEKALTLDANNREAIANKGYILLIQKRYDEAAEYAEKLMIV